MTLKVNRIRPAWLRLIVLTLIALPQVIGWPLTTLFTIDNSPRAAFIWFLYAGFLSLVIAVSIGAPRWLQLFSIASVLAVVTCMSGAAIRCISQVLMGNASGDSLELVGVRYLSLGATILSVVPYALFVVGCFSASHLMIAASRHGQRIRAVAKHVTLLLRLVQHVVEVLITLLIVWREQNPELFSPRHRKDIKGSLFTRLRAWVMWLYEAVLEWCIALLMHTLEPTPIFCAEIERFAKCKASGDNQK